MHQYFILGHYDTFSVGQNIFLLNKKKGKSRCYFPFTSLVSYHQKFVSIIFFLVLSVSAIVATPKNRTELKFTKTINFVI